MPVPTGLVRPAVLGGVDGLVTSFVIVAAGVAGSVEKRIVLLIGVASLVADAVSMAASEILSVRAEGGILTTALTQGSVCAASFLLLGTLPLVALALSTTVAVTATSSIAVFAFALCGIGLARARLTGERWSACVAEVLAIGCAAGLVGYAVAAIQSRL